MNDDSWDWLDWLIVFSPAIMNLVYVWHGIYTGEMSVETGIIAACVSAGAIIGAIFLKEFLYDRKNYEKLIKALGNVDSNKQQESIYDALSTQLGVNATDVGSISTQLGVSAAGAGSISTQLGVSAADVGSISAQLGIKLSGEGKNLSLQHKEIQEIVNKLSSDAEEVTLRNAQLSGDLREIADAVEKLAAFKDRLEREHHENIRLRLEIEELRKNIRDRSQEQEHGPEADQSTQDNSPPATYTPSPHFAENGESEQNDDESEQSEHNDNGIEA
jgi:regulator of replication initiation timing